MTARARALPAVRRSALAPGRLGFLLREVAAREPAYVAACILIAVSIPPVLLAGAIDPRLAGSGVMAEPIWIKPLKFQVALLMYLATLAAASLARPAPSGRVYRAFTWLAVAATLAEIAWIGGAAAMGTTSHFNVATPLAGTIYTAMGIAAVTLTSASLVTAIRIARGGILTGALRAGLVLGLGLTFFATVVVAGALSSMAGHLVGTPLTGARVPLMGWSREVGDLRVAHFMATHALHVLPVVALLASWRLRPVPALATVWAAAGAYAVLVALTFAQALSGLPLLPL